MEVHLRVIKAVKISFSEFDGFFSIVPGVLSSAQPTFFTSFARSVFSFFFFFQFFSVVEA